MHRNRLLLALTCVTLVTAITSGTATADLPDDQYISYYLREDPQDPNSDVSFTLNLTLEASILKPGSVAWDIALVTIIEHDQGDTYWSEENPFVDTSDGLWLVEHDDPQDPQPAEFAVPPLLSGTATPDDQQDPDLNYSLEGERYVRAPTPSYSGNVASLTYDLAADGGGQPQQADDDEPVEIFPESNPP